MRAETITYLKEHANNLNLDEELLITKNDKAAYAVQNASDYEYKQESLALLKLLKLSEKSKTISLEDAFK